MAATRLSITIPDQLAERLEPLRDRLNLSKICSEAIGREVAMLTDLTTDVRDFGDLIARLRGEKAGVVERLYKLGFECGHSYARSAGYEWLASTDYSGRTFGELPDGEREAALSGALADSGPAVIPLAEAYARGFWDGAAAVWQVVKDKI